MPKVSIIIPTFNSEKYITRCIESVINQTFKDFEVIIISDGGKQENKICSNYAQKYPFIRLIKGKKQGNGGARNIGLDFAEGEYIYFVDSDDWIEQETLERAVYYIEKYSADYVSWCANIVPEPGLEQSSKQVVEAQNYHKLKLTGFYNLDDLIIRKTTVTLWNKLFRRELINKNKIRFPLKLHYEDNEFFFKYYLISKTAYYMDAYLYNYYQRLDSQMGKQYYGKSQKVDDCITVYEHIYNYCKRNNCIEEHQVLLRDFFNSALNKLNYSVDKNKTKKKLIALAKKIDNTILKFNKIDFVKNNEFDKIDNSKAVREGLYSKIFYFRYIKPQIVIVIFGIKISFKLKRRLCQKFQ